MRERLAAALAGDGFTVDEAAGHDEVLAILKRGRRDAVISEARRDRFAEFLRLMLRLDPALRVHLFQEGQVFCHYPARGQPVALLFALDEAGLSFPGATPAGRLPDPYLIEA